MPQPEYRVRASGMGGSGYARPPLPGEPFKTVNNADGKPIKVVVGDDGKPIVVPGVTTVLKAFGDAPALVQWKIDQTAAYAAWNAESLLNRTTDQAFKSLRFWHKRVPDLDDPVRNAANGVLDDLAELGTNIHEWVQETEIGQAFPPPITSVEMQQMAEAWKRWRFINEVEPYLTEVTVYGDGYAGTFDCLWRINGVMSLIDIKSSRAVRDGHLMQLSALRAAEWMYVLNADGEYERVEVPKPEEYGFLQIRPNDTDTKGNFVEKFVQYHKVGEDELALHFQKFMHALNVLQLNREIKQRFDRS